MLWWKRGVLLAAISAALVTACSAEDPGSVSGPLYTVVITEFDPDSKIRVIKPSGKNPGSELQTRSASSRVRQPCCEPASRESTANSALQMRFDSLLESTLGASATASALLSAVERPVR